LILSFKVESHRSAVDLW